MEWREGVGWVEMAVAAEREGECDSDCIQTLACQSWFQTVPFKFDLRHYCQGAHGGNVNSVAFHPSGNFLLTASNDNTLKAGRVYVWG